MRVGVAKHCELTSKQMNQPLFQITINHFNHELVVFNEDFHWLLDGITLTYYFNEENSRLLDRK